MEKKGWFSGIDVEQVRAAKEKWKHLRRPLLDGGEASEVDPVTEEFELSYSEADEPPSEYYFPRLNTDEGCDLSSSEVDPRLTGDDSSDSPPVKKPIRPMMDLNNQPQKLTR